MKVFTPILILGSFCISGQANESGIKKDLEAKLVQFFSTYISNCHTDVKSDSLLKKNLTDHFFKYVNKSMDSNGDPFHEEDPIVHGQDCPEQGSVSAKVEKFGMKESNASVTLSSGQIIRVKLVKIGPTWKIDDTK